MVYNNRESIERQIRLYMDTPVTCRAGLAVMIST
jgi:hypothetical protein